MPKKSVVVGSVVGAAVLLAAGTATAISLSSRSGDDDTTVVTVNLWDEGVAAAYETSFAAFEKQHTDIDVQVVITPWASYWDDLLVDVGGGTASDIFWLNSTFTTYADNGNLLDITDVLGADAISAWDTSVVDQYTRNGSLWGVPQLADGGKAIIVNTELLDAAGLTTDDLQDLVWDPSGANDTLIPTLQQLTLDADGRTADDPDFDADAITQFGYNAAYDSDAIVFNYVGSNGGEWRTADSFTFADEASAEAISYVVGLINTEHVAPSAADTNENGDFSKDQFLQGNLALFQTGLFNVAAVAEGADFEWSVVPVPEGPAGRQTVTNGIIAAGNADSEHPEETLEVLRWLASAEGSEAIGATGSAVPAVLAAQDAYDAVWSDQGIDVSPFFDVDTFTLPVLESTNVSEASAEIDPVLKEVFLGRIPVDEGLQQAQDAANAAL